MPEQRPIHILIVGAGAIGCFYGSRLHLPSHNPPAEVSLICRSNYKAVSSKGGVDLKTRSFGSYFFKPSHIFPSIQSAAQSGVKWDYIVVATKSLPDVSDDSSRIESLVWDGATIVLIQNGVGVEQPYRERFKKTTILSGVTVASAEQIEDGVVVQNRWTRISCELLTVRPA
ncbi:hypothetical protein FRC03_007100 [Tulasnella sp. 419]|nr:hypothetical protein FRC03_007100 [Tulasnella sp. 419]